MVVGQFFEIGLLVEPITTDFKDVFLFTAVDLKFLSNFFHLYEKCQHKTPIIIK